MKNLKSRTGNFDQQEQIFLNQEEIRLEELLIESAEILLEEEVISGEFNNNINNLTINNLPKMSLKY